MDNERLICLGNDIATLRGWLRHDLAHLTDPQRMDYREVLDGMERDVAALRVLLAAPERAAAAEHRDGDDLDALAVLL